MKAVIALAAMLVASPALAESGRTIWNNVETGMTAAEVRAMYPARVPNPDRPGRTMVAGVHHTNSVEVYGFPIMEGCKGTVEIEHGDTVKLVTVKGEAWTGCKRDAILGALVAKYGQPDTNGVRQIGNDFIDPRINAAVGSHEENEARWVKDGLVIRVVGLTVTYTPVGPVSSSSL